MPQFQRAYADWKAPAEDGKVVLWPEARELIAHTRENHSRLTKCRSARIQNLPLSELRSEARRFLGHDDDRLLIATGHQTELYHAGVWAKEALIHAAAEKISGSAIHIAVDTDGPKHLTLRWPEYSIPITDDPSLSRAAWSGLLDTPTPEHLLNIERDAAGASSHWGYSPMLPEIIDSLRKSAMEQDQLSPAITKAMHLLDHRLGLRNETVLASPVWLSDTFLVFAHHILSRPAEFASHYNGALKNYRDRTGTQNRMRPMPDLFVGHEAIESPFWLDDLKEGTRSRPSIFETERGWVLELLNGDELILDPKRDAREAARALSMFLSRNGLRLAPRALTLTIYFRLLVVDQFVHGIGGGRYDQVADEIIASHFGIDPPHFGVTTATLYLPQALGRTRVCLPCLAREGHRLIHGALGAVKLAAVREIEAAPRRSPRRAELFYAMHRRLAAAANSDPKVKSWKQRSEDGAVRAREEKTLFDRELFYAIQPQSRLESIISSYKDMFASS